MGLFDRVGSMLIPVSKNGDSPSMEVAVVEAPTLPVPEEGKASTNVVIRQGITFTGPRIANDQLIHLDVGGAHPNAEVLSRSIALATSAYAYTAIMYRARRVAEPPMMVVQETDDGDEWLPNHELASILDSPSQDFDMGELQQLTEIYRMVTGSCLWARQRDLIDREAGIVPFSGDEFEVKSTDDRIYGEFVVTTRGGRKRTLTPDQVIYFREPNPASWKSGLAPLDVALSMLDLGHQVNRTVRTFMRKAMFPGGVVSPDKEWDPDDDEFEQYKAAIAAWHGGPANAGEPLVLLGGSTFSRAAVPMKELLPSEILDRIEATVGSVFGIPPVVLGWLVGLKNSPWSQMSEARTMTYEDTIEPRWRDVEKRMTRQLVSPGDRARSIRISFDTSKVRALQEDLAAKADITVKVGDNWTRDEKRIFTGQEPDGKPDQPEDPANSMPNDPEAEVQPTAQPGSDDEVGTAAEVTLNGAQITAALEVIARLSGGGVDENGEPVGSTISPMAAIELLVAVGIRRDRAEAMVAEETKSSPEALEWKASPDGINWVVFDVSCKAAESRWEREIASVLEEQKSKTLALARKHFESQKKAIDPDSTLPFQTELGEYLNEEGLRKFVSRVYPFALSTSTQGVKHLASNLGLSFSVLEPGLAEFATQESSFLASVMGETTGNAVAKAVQDGLAEGETIKELMKRLEDLPAFSRDRAKLTARTETTRAWNGAQRRSLSGFQKQSGRVASKTWSSSHDNRVRPEHQELDGEQKGIDEPFSNGLLSPGEPNCRCTCVYSLSDPIQGE